MPHASHPAPSHASLNPHASNGATLVSLDGRTLPLRGARLRAEAKGGVARAILEQTFHNPYAEPLRVTYRMPLPADGAVSGYAFRIGDRRIVGEVDKKRAARERFERALVEGRTAALTEQERSSLFTQELGNVPPGAEVVAELSVDQKLVWLPEGLWEWRFPTAAAPRYLGEPGRIADAERVTLEVADRPLPISVQLSLTIGDAMDDSRDNVAAIESPSHAVTSSRESGGWRVAFAQEQGAALDRDIVVRWRAAVHETRASLELARPPAGARLPDATYGLLTLVPPKHPAAPRTMARDLILLLDTSGSMGGEPLDQSRRIAQALVDSLTERDSLELIEFSDEPRRWKKKPVAATPKHKAEALRWLAALQASGGTEMRSGILEALAPLHADAQRQVVILTDGQIGMEEEVLRTLCEKLPATARFHTVGVGSAVNRSFTAPAARAGRGVELVIGLGEDVERATSRILARTQAPLVTELQVKGNALLELAPQRPPDLFAGAPALLSVRLRPEGGELRVQGKTPQGLWEQRLQVPPQAQGEGSLHLATLYAREAVEDCELGLAAGISSRPESNERIEALGLTFQIATRLTSWVAVSDEVTVDPTKASREQTIPQQLPHGMSASGLGLRPALPSLAAPAGAGATAFAPTAGASAGMFGGLARRMRAALGAGGAPPKAGKAMESAFEPPEPPGDLRDDEADRGLPAPAEANFDAELAGSAFDEGGLREEETTGAPAKPGAAAPPPPPAAAPARAAPSAPMKEAEKQALKKRDQAAKRRRSLRGLLRLLTEKELVVEWRVDGPDLDWKAPATVEVVLSDGRTLTVRVDLARTTGPGPASSGAMVRLALEWTPAPSGAMPTRLRVELDGDELSVEL